MNHEANSTDDVRMAYASRLVFLCSVILVEECVLLVCWSWIPWVLKCVNIFVSFYWAFQITFDKLLFLLILKGRLQPCEFVRSMSVYGIQGTNELISDVSDDFTREHEVVQSCSLVIGVHNEKKFQPPIKQYQAISIGTNLECVMHNDSDCMFISK